MDINDQLRCLYKSKWNDLCSAMKTIVNDDNFSEKPTNPLLLWTGKGNDEEYEKSDVRVMVFGQETNDWEGVFNPYADESKEIERILEIYNVFFDFEYYKHHGGQFWNGFRLFKKMLNEKFQDKKVEFVWDNIIKIGKAKKKNCPPDYIYNIENKYFSVVNEEINILKPNIILFLTGYNYDCRIKDKLGNIPLYKFCSYKEKEIAKLLIPNVSFVYRTYHPNYLYRQGKGVIDEYFSSIINDINI